MCNTHADRVLRLPFVKTLSGTLTRSVGIECQHYAIRKALQNTHVLFGERCSTCCNRASNASSMKTNDVGIALANDNLIACHDVGLCPIQPIQGARLGIDRSFWRVLVFRRVGAARHNTPAKGQHVSGVGKNRKQNAGAKSVLQFPALVGECQASFSQVFYRGLFSLR